MPYASKLATPPEIEKPSVLLKAFCAQDWIRTSTSLRTLRPEHSASTNFATWAIQGLQMYKKIV